MADARPKLDTRLKEVHQSDLTEGRINQDFVDWLKTKGMSYLLVVLLVLCGYLVFVRWQNYHTHHQAEAWRELSSAVLPTSLEEVAQKYEGVGSVALLARMHAAEELLSAVQLGKSLGADAASRTDLTAEQRDDYLNRADRLYSEMLAADDNSTGKTLLMVTAWTGRAAIAESRGDTAKAKEYYNKAADRAGTTYPELAAQSRARGEKAANMPATPTSMPSEEQLKSLDPKPDPDSPPLNVEGWLNKIMGGEDTDKARGRRPPQPG